MGASKMVEPRLMLFFSMISCRKVNITSLLLLVVLAACSGDDERNREQTAEQPSTESASPLKVETISLSLLNGATFEVDRGFLTVPENRSIDGSATIQIGFYHLKSSAAVPATPIFVLPGGPGSSWIQQINNVADRSGPETATDQAFIQEHFFEDLRSVADVVIVDQRSAGISTPRLTCSDQSRVPHDQPVTSATFSVTAKAFTKNCLAELDEAGRDIDGYTVFDLTDDLNTLRQALGYEKISLFAGSFGSQWGMTFIKRNEAVVERFIFWGAEGLDHAYDSPTGVLNAMAAIYDDTAQGISDDSSDIVPFRTRLTDALESLRLSPALQRDLPGEENGSAGLSFGPDELQWALYGMGDYSVGNRSSISSWFSYATDLLAGDVSAALPIVLDYRQINRPGFPVAQYLSIDCGLGISKERRQQIESDAALALIGNINFRYDVICAEWPAFDVGDDFRAPKTSNLPGLLFHGTWDVSTPLNNAIEVSHLFPNSQLITVERATHKILRELYREKPDETRSIIRDFLRGNAVSAPDRIELPQVPASH